MIIKLIQKLLKINKTPAKNMEINSMLIRNGIEFTFSDLTFTPSMYLDALENILENKKEYPSDVVNIATGINIKDVYDHLEKYDKYTSSCCSGGYSGMR
jgi:hypothetical protein